MIRHIMVDLETMGTRPTAAIVSIGAVAIDIENNKLLDKFYTNIDLQSCIDLGCTVDGTTVVWWMRQEDKAREALGKGHPLAFALYDFSLFVQRGKDYVNVEDVRMWGNGSDFDNVILAHAYRRINKTPPWNFRGSRCFRTLRAGHPEVEDLPSNGVKHNALDDAIWQAQMLLAMIGGKQHG